MRPSMCSLWVFDVLPLALIAQLQADRVRNLTLSGNDELLDTVSEYILNRDRLLCIFDHDLHCRLYRLGTRDAHKVIMNINSDTSIHRPIRIALALIPYLCDLIPNGGLRIKCNNRT